MAITGRAGECHRGSLGTYTVTLMSRPREIPEELCGDSTSTSALARAYAQTMFPTNTEFLCTSFLYSPQTHMVTPTTSLIQPHTKHAHVHSAYSVRMFTAHTRNKAGPQSHRTNTRHTRLLSMTLVLAVRSIWCHANPLALGSFLINRPMAWARQRLHPRLLRALDSAHVQLHD